MAQQNEKQPKAKTGLARCLELASGHKGLVFLAGFLAALAAICSFVPYLSIYYIIREILFVYPDMSLLNVSTISTWGWLTLAGILGNIVFYFFALLCSHVAAFGTLYELKVAFADHIMHIPLGYHLTLGSGKLRKIMDENIESVEKFIAHQLPDFVASLVAPLVLVIILLGIDWRYGVVCLVGIVLAFIVQFAGFNGEAKEKMHRFQTAQENMNSASVEYVRGMSEIKAFNQTADSFKRLSKSITDYTQRQALKHRSRTAFPSTSCATRIPPAITVLSPTTACRPLAGLWTRPIIRKCMLHRWLLAPRWRTSTAHSMWTIRQTLRDTRCPFRMWWCCTRTGRTPPTTATVWASSRCRSSCGKTRCAPQNFPPNKTKI